MTNPKLIIWLPPTLPQDMPQARALINAMEKIEQRYRRGLLNRQE
jgi:hypothetical protein